MDTKLEKQPGKESERSHWVAEKLDLLAPETTPSRRVARAEFNSRLAAKEESMWKNLFKPKYRGAWLTVSLVAILAISLTIPQVRVIANSFLGLFRVEQIEAVDVGISLSNIPLEMEQDFEAISVLVGEQLVMDQVAQPVQVADITEARNRAGFAARQPTYPPGERKIFYQEAATLRLVIDQKKWQAMVDAMGYNEFIIPRSTDGAEVTIHIPAGVILGIGDCQYSELNELQLGHPAAENCTVFLQSTSPTIEAPAELDIHKAGELLLQALGMSPEQAAQFSATVNWATTLVIPVPKDMEYRQVTVEGTDGIYLVEEKYPGVKAVYTLLWLKDGVINALVGEGSLEEALQVVESLE